jgi:hypothetical protein
LSNDRFAIPLPNLFRLNDRLRQERPFVDRFRRAQGDAIGHLKPSAGSSSWAKTSQLGYDGSDPMMCVANIKAASDMAH